MLLGLALAVLAALILARRITEPVRVLQAGADRLGGGDLDYRIELRTGDDLESLATAFNAMADRLRESYSSLERKVEERTGELSRSLAAEAASARENERLVDELTARSEALARSVEELRALGAAGEAMVGTLDLGRVLDTLLPKAAALANADSALLFRYRRERKELELWRDHDLPDGLAEDIARTPYLPAEPIVGRALGERRTQVIDDAAAVSGSTLAVRLRQAGYPALIVVPLARGRRAIGAIALLYRDPARIPERAADLMQTFASQSILAIQNARLFREIEEKGRQLELASQHKSQFLANMSHELRTPLNAILGYAELLADELYGPLGAQQRDVLGRVQANGHHLLNLINDVLDLSKIEAGQLRLAIDDYSLADVVRSVVSATESLAAGKGLALEAAVADGLPPGRGDDRRLTQVLFNLVGNAVKFTDTGRVEIRARENAGRFVVEVIDTGPGIRDADQAWIFQEFQQVDNTSTRKKGGSGLGLAISRRIVELHGGTLSVESEPGRGSTFRVVVPVITAADDAP
jgi:signal transduction histidine kinase/HAMP domain-containing protein